jgi:ferredoxin-thioredoxin reductase catalytic subunit
MPKRISKTPITPEVQEVINRWRYFANKHGILLSPPSVISDIAFKAKINTEYSGACICKRYERPVCPCPECLPEVKSHGICFCHIFCSQEYIDNPSKFRN